MSSTHAVLAVPPSMSQDELDEQLYAEVEAELDANDEKLFAEDDDDLAMLQRKVDALDEEDELTELQRKVDALGGEFKEIDTEFTFDGTGKVTRKTTHRSEPQDNGHSSQNEFYESVERQLEKEVDEERRAEKEIRALREEVAALEREVAKTDAERANSAEAKEATEEISEGAAQQAVRILAEEESNSKSTPTSAAAAKPGLDDNIAPWLREMQQCVSTSLIVVACATACSKRAHSVF